MKIILKRALQYALLGPVFGTIFIIFFGLIMSFGRSSGSLGNITSGIAGFPFLLLYAIPFGYFLGGLQAFFVGIFTGIFESYYGKQSFRYPLFATFLTWLGFTSYSSQILNNDRIESLVSADAIFWFCLYVFSAASVWKFLKLWPKGYF